MKYWLIAVCVCLQGAAFAQLETDDAFVMQLNRDGFSLLSEEIRQTQLGDVSASMPEVREKGPLGIDIEVNGINYAIQFDSLSIVPEAGRLAVDVAVKHVSLHANEMKFRKKVLVTISASCRGTDISAGHAGPLHLKAWLAPRVENRQLRFTTEKIDFNIAENNFKVDGPRDCSGALGIGTVIKWIVGKVIANSRGKIEEAVRSKVAGFVPVLEDRIHQSIHRKFPLDIANFLPTKDSQVVLETFPYAVSVTPEQMDFRLSVDVAAGLEEEERYWDFSDAGPFKVGAIGINPALLTEVFAKSFPQGTPFTELSAETLPQIGEVLSVKTLSTILPDLKVATLGRDHLRAFVRFASTPKFVPVNGQNVLKIEIPNFQLMFQAHLNGNWQDYFILNLNVDTGVKLSVENGKVMLEITPESIVGVTGNWAKGYTPKDPKFESEFTEFLFSSILEYLASQGPVVRLAVPTTQIAGKTVTVVSPEMKTPFVMATLVRLND